MPKSGDQYKVSIKMSHLDWGRHRYTHTRERIEGEGYVKIPKSAAIGYGIMLGNCYTATFSDGFPSFAIRAAGNSTAGDPYAKQVCDEYIHYLAEGITNMINIFQPHILCIGGGVCNEKEYLTVPLTEIVERDQYTRTNKVKTKIVTATLGNDAGIIGAASLGR